MDTPIVEAKEVSKTYRSKGGELVRALESADLKVFRGEFLALVGRSGAGKTTLLNLIGALDLPSSGTMLLDGVDLSKIPSRELASVRRRKIGFIFQDFNLLPVLTVSENLEAALALTDTPMKEQKTRITNLLTSFELEKKANCLPNELSIGQQQRVAIARALINNPPLILADEPTGQVDPITSNGVVNMLVELRRRLNVTLIVATHGAFPYSVADRALFMKDGRIVSFEDAGY